MNQSSRVGIDIGGTFTDWTPLAHRGGLYPEVVDRSDPWQFLNFRIVC